METVWLSPSSIIFAMSQHFFGSGINGNPSDTILPTPYCWRHNTSSEVELMETITPNRTQGIRGHNTSSEVELMETLG